MPATSPSERSGEKPEWAGGRPEGTPTSVLSSLGLSLPGLGGCGEVAPERPPTRGRADPGPAGAARRASETVTTVPWRAGRWKGWSAATRTGVPAVPRPALPGGGAWPRLSLCHCGGHNATSPHPESPRVLCCCCTEHSDPHKGGGCPTRKTMTCGVAQGTDPHWVTLLHRL